ncbi:M12 family metallopeptidase [bacterium]|nr:M12 family metallopeptidase [bacterium]
MKKIIILTLVLLILVYFFNRDHQTNNIEDVSTSDSSNQNNEKNINSVVSVKKNVDENEFQSKSAEVIQQNKANDLAASGPSIEITQREKLAEQSLLTYTIDDGLAVVQGDIIIGEVPRDKLLKSLSGSVREPPLKIWPTTEIPVYVQPNLPNPERVTEALAYFSGTNVHFVTHVNQEDVLVFQKGQGTCKSYLGYIGGKQPIFLADACSAHDIAHEIMHALGFIHEQNRADRDAYIDIVWANIDSRFTINFEKFSTSLMKVSGLSKFDFESIMIYPQTMFSANGQTTMKSKIDGEMVNPRQGLSEKDKERINKTYF